MNEDSGDFKNSEDAFELCNGPQDGARVQGVGEVMPQTIYVGPKWMGDGFASWGREFSERFPCKYVRGVHQFHFSPEWPD